MNSDLNFLALSITALCDCEKSERTRTMLADMMKSMNSAISRDIKMAAEIEQLRAELEQAKNRISEIEDDSIRYNNLISSGLICNVCGGSGIVGNPPDDYYDCPDCAKINRSLEADSIIKAAKECLSEGRLRNDTMRAFCFASDLHRYAEKVRKGEI